MKIFKSKSLSHLTNEQIEKGIHNVRFISFESAIQLMREHYNLMDLKNKPLGYRVTEQGIEIIFN